MNNLIRGNKYCFKYKTERQKHMRVCIMMYLGEDDKSYILSGRPTIGTQYLLKEWVHEIVPVPDNSLAGKITTQSI